jgi:mannose-6-phosphate isomerase-like protein (cupin superfamily)
MSEVQKVTVYKWPHKAAPTPESVKKEMLQFGFEVYDLQTIPPWFERSSHSHDYDEIRGATEGCITFYFEGMLPLTLEAGDILLIPGGIPHTVISHNANPFVAYKGSRSGKRSVTEHGDGKGSLEQLDQNAAKAQGSQKG